MPISKIKTSSITADAASTNLNIDANTLFLDAANNRVGVGTTSPGQNLHVASSSTGQTLVNIENTSAGGYSWNIGTIGSVAGLGPVGTFIIRDSTNGANRIAIDTSGNMGVGTASPGEKLHVSGNIRMSAVAGTNTNAALPVLFQTSTGTIEGGSGLTYNPGGDVLGVNGMSITASQCSGAGSSATFTCANGAGQYDFVATSDSLRFTAGSSERMRITSGGNVGIGLSSPQTKLDVNGVLRLTPNSADTGYTADIMANYNSEHPFQINVKNNGSTAEYFGVYAGAGGSNNRVVFPNGRVGISTTDPQGMLEIAFGTDPISLINATTLAQGNRAALMMAARNVNGNTGNVSIEAISVNNQQNDMVFRTGATTMTAFGTERMRIDTSGRVTKQNQPLLSVGRSAGNVNQQTYPIPYNQVVTNIGNHWNASTYRFTAPVTGYYFCTIRAIATSTGVEVAIYKNGGTVVNCRVYANGSSASSSEVVYCVANDYIDAKVEGSYPMEGGSGYQYSGMTIYLLG